MTKRGRTVTGEKAKEIKEFFGDINDQMMEGFNRITPPSADYRRSTKYQQHLCENEDGTHLIVSVHIRDMTVEELNKANKKKAKKKRKMLKKDPLGELIRALSKMEEKYPQNDDSKNQ